MGKLVNRAKMTVASAPGTGAATLGAAVAGYQTFAAGGVANGDLVSYVIEDGSNWEFGEGSYSSTGPTLTRTTILGSSNSGSAISATSAALVFVSPLAADLPHAGEVAWFAASSAPSGFMAADGSAVSRTTYAALLNAIGTTFGAGDGSTTFNLPDLRGVFVRGLDNGRGLDSGRTFGSYQADMYASHTHTVTDPGHYHSLGVYTGSSGGQAGAGTNGNISYPLSSGSKTTGVTIASAGAAETAPKNVALLACIRY